MFELVRPEPAKNILSKLYIRGQALNSENDFKHPLVRDCVEMFAEGMIPVWLDHNGTMTCVHPPAPIQRVLILGEAAPDRETADEAQKWRHVWEAF